MQQMEETDSNTTNTNESLNQSSTIQSLSQWMFDEFRVGTIVIPHAHISPTLFIDSTFLLEWPFLLGVKHKHVFPIMNTYCSLDWIQSRSALEDYYLKNKRNVFEKKSKQVPQEEQRVYECGLKKDSKQTYTLKNIQSHLKQLDYIIIPFWNKQMLNVLRTAMFRMMSHPYSKKSSIFSRKWASHLEKLFSFFEREFVKPNKE